MRVGVDPEDMVDLPEQDGIELVKASDPRLFVSIGDGNKKIGHIPSWSLPHPKTCNPRASAFCARQCYNNRIRDMFPNVWAMWNQNLWMAQNYPALTELLIRKYLCMALPQLMRLHVAGDFFSRDYLDMWRRIAADHPSTVFYGYTKMDGLDHDALPGNLRLLRSQWPGMPPPRQRHVKRNCWVDDGTDRRIPKRVLRCCGDCPRCGFKCAFGDGDVAIPMHR